MTRLLPLLIFAVSCGPVTIDDFGLPGEGGSPTGSEESGGSGESLCEFSPGAVFGPCFEDGTCGEGLICIPALGEGGSICVSVCTPTCDPMCGAPGNAGCNPAGICALFCKGPDDQESCLPGQFCAQGGDTAPWECFWPRS